MLTTRSRWRTPSASDQGAFLAVSAATFVPLDRLEAAMAPCLASFVRRVHLLPSQGCRSASTVRSITTLQTLAPTAARGVCLFASPAISAAAPVVLLALSLATSVGMAFTRKSMAVSCAKSAPMEKAPRERVVPTSMTAFRFVEMENKALRRSVTMATRLEAMGVTASARLRRDTRAKGACRQRAPATRWCVETARFSLLLMGKLWRNATRATPRVGMGAVLSVRWRQATSVRYTRTRE
mmetsp:Transcript_32408/g.81663  ORF Transcript_32408/g.81663 Transcript_32408/m.81663 type:complete len:239 (+) Transcript_32408:566-1282(+)